MFNPKNVSYYNAPWTPQRSPDRERHQQWVQAQDYDQLLERYNLLLVSEPARVVPFKDGYWVFAKEYSFFTKSPENGHFPCTGHKWLDTNGQLPCWPPIKIYKCVLCGLTGNLQGRLLTPNGFPQYDLSDMTYEGCPEKGQPK